jgi:hypothetical protein
MIERLVLDGDNDTQISMLMKQISKINEIIDQINGWRPTALDTKQEKCPTMQQGLNLCDRCKGSGKENVIGLGFMNCPNCNGTGTMGER